MKINGISFPSGMGLSDFLKKTKQGTEGVVFENLASPYMQSEDDVSGRLGMLNMLSEVGNPEAITINSGSAPVRTMLNTAMYGTPLANSIKNYVPNGDNSALRQLFKLDEQSDATGLPIWQLDQNEFPKMDEDILALNQTFPSDLADYYAPARETAELLNLLSDEELLEYLKRNGGR